MTQDVEKKCSLLGRFVTDTDSRSSYTEKVKRNLPAHLNTAEKVKLKISRNAITVTDRSIWQNKLERIPMSLVIDCHTDDESPKICYFVNETVTGRFQVLVFLCKTVDDSIKLVANCCCRSKLIEFYSQHNDTEVDNKPLKVSKAQKLTMPSQRNAVMSHALDAHSAEVPPLSPGNRGYKGNFEVIQAVEKPFPYSGKESEKFNYRSSVQQYDSDSSSNKLGLTVQHNSDGVARIAVGSIDKSHGEMTEYKINEKNSQLQIKMDPSSELIPTIYSDTITHCNSRHMHSSPPRGRQPPTDDTIAMHDDHNDHQLGYNSSTSIQKQQSRNVPYDSLNAFHNCERISASDDSEFEFILTGLNRIESNPSKCQQRTEGIQHHLQVVNSSLFKDQTNRSNGSISGKMISTTDQVQTRRRKAPFQSIQEYEQQKNPGNSFLQQVFGTENIEPSWITKPSSNAQVLNSNTPQSFGTSERLARCNLCVENAPTGFRFSPANVSTIVQGSFSPVPLSSLRGHQIPSHNTPPKVVDRQIPQAVQVGHQKTRDLVRANINRPRVNQQQPNQFVAHSGKGDNYLLNEGFKLDDNHKFYRQHGQRFKHSVDSDQKLYLDKRLAETNDIIGDQLVRGQHLQKVNGMESIGPNYQSHFHSEMRISHQTSQALGTGNSPIGRPNCKPVNTVNHPWPMFPLLKANMHPPNTLDCVSQDTPGNRISVPYMNCFQQTSQSELKPLGFQNFQQLFEPQLTVPKPMGLNPGFQRFFESIENFGPTGKNLERIEAPRFEKPLALEPPSDDQSAGDLAVLETLSSGRDDSEASSIRSSASAYWPPELRFHSIEDEVSKWKFHKPIMQLRRKTSNGVIGKGGR